MRDIDAINIKVSSTLRQSMKVHFKEVDGKLTVNIVKLIFGLFMRWYILRQRFSVRKIVITTLVYTLMNTKLRAFFNDGKRMIAIRAAISNRFISMMILPYL